MNRTPPPAVEFVEAVFIEAHRQRTLPGRDANIAAAVVAIRAVYTAASAGNVTCLRAVSEIERLVPSSILSAPTAPPVVAAANPSPAELETNPT